MAHELVAVYPGERIQAEIEVLDWLISRKDRRIATSPAGYLVKSIRDDLAWPKGFESQEHRGRPLEAEGQKRRAESRRRARAEAQAQVKAEQDRIAQFWDDLTPAEQDWIRSEAIASADKFFHSRARVARFGVATAWTATRLSTAALAALSHPWPSRLDPRAKRPRVNTGREKQYPREDARLRRSDRRKQPAREAMATVRFG